MKTSQHGARSARRLLFGLFAFCAALMLLALTSGRVFADAVNIYDNAHVLDATQVYNEASQLPNPVDIYTTKTFNGSTTAFDKFTVTLIGLNDGNEIVMNIDTVHRQLAIVGGTQVPLSSDQYAAAIQAFMDNLNNGDYTGATVAALQSLNTVLAPAPDTSNNGFPPNGQIDSGPIQTSYPNSSPDVSSIMPLIFTGLAIVFVVYIMRALARSASGGRRSMVARNAQPLDATPFEAGAIGTMAGGMVGYELGREEMERQNSERIQQQMFNNDNSFGGGNTGGGSSGNF